MTKPRRSGGKRAVGRQPKHGARALARHLAAGTLDQRTWVAKALRSLREELATDAGGWEKLGARERILIDRTAAACLVLESIERWLFQQDGPVQPDGQLIAVLSRGYVSHLAQLVRCLTALGLRPEGSAHRIPRDVQGGTGVLQIPTPFESSEEWSAATRAFFDRPHELAAPPEPVRIEVPEPPDEPVAGEQAQSPPTAAPRRRKWRWGW